MRGRGIEGGTGEGRVLLASQPQITNTSVQAVLIRCKRRRRDEDETRAEEKITRTCLELDDEFPEGFNLHEAFTEGLGASRIKGYIQAAGNMSQE